MTAQDCEEWSEAFESFHGRFSSCFRRRESRETAVAYLRGLLSPVARKNGWQLAEAMGMAVPDRIQRLLYRTPWDADQVLTLYQEFVVESFGDAEGIAVLDETGFLKKGDKSAGVQRQYTGTAGKIANGQVGVFLCYVGRGSQVLLDRRLYLPESWCRDAARCRKAKVPPEIVFATKPELAAQMLRHAWDREVPMRWVIGDEVYGNSTALRDAVIEADRLYLLDVASHMTLFPGDGGAMETVTQRVSDWAASAWERLTVSGGEKGPRVYDWAADQVVETREGKPGPSAWLLARRWVSDPKEVAYYFSNAAEETPLTQLAEVASARYRVEQGFEQAKGRRGWTSMRSVIGTVGIVTSPCR